MDVYAYLNDKLLEEYNHCRPLVAGCVRLLQLGEEPWTMEWSAERARPRERLSGKLSPLPQSRIHNYTRYSPCDEQDDKTVEKH